MKRLFILAYLFLMVVFCVLETTTDQCSEPHKVFRACGCPLTCENDTEILNEGYPRPSQYIGLRKGRCAETCVEGCQCEDNYYDDGKGNCVRVENCPMPYTCPGENEKLIADGKNGCEQRNCQMLIEEDFQHSRGVNCHIEEYTWQCACKDGYVRNDGKCIPIRNCPNYPPICSDTRKEFKECGSPCPPSCDYVGKPDKCMNICVSACYCKEGYVMDMGQNCIFEHECPKELPKLPFEDDEKYTLQEIGQEDFCHRPHEVWLVCGPSRHPRCNNRHPPANDVRCYGDCYCDVGYILDNAGQECIPEQDCL